MPISGGLFAAGERERRRKRDKGKEKAVLRKGKREGGEGKTGGREMGRRRERDGRGVCVIGVRGDRRPDLTGVRHTPVKLKKTVRGKRSKSL